MLRPRLLIIILGSFLALILLAWIRDDIVKLPSTISNKIKKKPTVPPSDGTEGWKGGDLMGPGPDYERFTLAEQALPQHNLDLPFPEGKTGRYVRFSNQMNLIGWNNVLSEFLLSSHLAWRSKRAYVWMDYYWAPEKYPWKHPDWPMPKNPLTTFISGPTVGGPWPAGDDSPRSVSLDWFKIVCPEEEVFKLDSDVGKNPVFEADGKVYIDHWVKLLSEHEARCIEIVNSLSGNDSYSQTFDLRLMGSTRVLSIWPEFKNSPVSQLLGPSPLVLQALSHNTHLLFPPASKFFPRPPYGYDPFAHMMAMHVRREDYLSHCNTLSGVNASFWEWSLLPDLPDPYTPLPIDFPIFGEPPEVRAHVLERCLPTNEHIVNKILKSKADWEAVPQPANAPKRSIEILYIMTNGDRAWVDELSGLLKGKAGSGNHFHVVTSKDMQFDFEETGVGMVVDMEIGAKAAVFIGNGWSSFTGNILHRRLVADKEWIANRFW